MAKFANIKKAWSLLDAVERRSAIRVLMLMLAAAISSAAMVGSVFPFLAVLSNPEMIQENSVTSYLYSFGNFENNYDFLFALGLGAIAIICVSSFLMWLNVLSITRFTSMQVHFISRRLLAHYLAQPYVFFLNESTGDLSSKILMETQLIVQQFLRPLADILSSSLIVIAVTATLMVADPFVATVTITMFVVIYGTMMLLSRRYVRALGKVRAKANKARFNVASEAIRGIKEIKLLGKETVYLSRYDTSSIEMARSQIGVGVVAQMPRFAVQFIIFSGLIILCLAMLDPNNLDERDALGEFLPIVGLMALAGQRMMPELSKIFSSFTLLMAGTAALERVYDDLVRGTQPKPSAPPESRMGLMDALELEGVSHSYPNAEREGLSDVTLSIRAGERIGIIGTSGAGKTTLADIILGLLVPTRGVIRADGTPIDEDNLRGWQQSVGYVPQGIFLVDATMSENIALGISHDLIDVERVEHCAKIAQLHDFIISKLPDGYATEIGENGVRLSGGQRQRIGIARALYHDADLMIFDEATSALDNMTETEVMASIDALPGGKTLILIAHRLSTLRTCDRIVVMDQGKVSAIGTWEELQDSSKIFQNLEKPAQNVG